MEESSQPKVSVSLLPQKEPSIFIEQDVERDTDKVCFAVKHNI
jgi:hypothetical protein